MEYAIGIILAIVTCGAAWLAGFDRERVFYPTVMIVIATYYVLFALMGGGEMALWLETAVATAFLLVAVAGFRINLWIVVAALAAHGIFDLAHPHLYRNDGVPAWWPGFCLAFDVAAALILGVLLLKRPVLVSAWT